MSLKSTTSQGPFGAPFPNAWIFNFESTASLLIAFSGFLSSLVEYGCLPSGPVYDWLQDCFLVFQLPVFYFGYGYLFQNGWIVSNLRQWGLSTRREIILMLVPLTVITFFTLLINSWVGVTPTFSFTNLVVAIFWEPVIPVGFFLVSLVMYIVTPTLRKPRHGFILVGLALAFKIAAVILLTIPASHQWFVELPYIVQNFSGAWIWFVLGMVACYASGYWKSLSDNIPASGPAPSLSSRARLLKACVTWMGLTVNLDHQKAHRRCLITTAMWIGLSILMFALHTPTPVLSAVMTITGLYWLGGLFATRFIHGSQWGFYGFIDSYTKGIWLMHPMFMKGYFFILQIVGVHSLGLGNPLYWVAYLCGTFAVIYLLPIGVLWVLNHVWKLGFVINPQNYLPKVKE